METNPNPNDELFTLCDELLEGRLSAGNLARLEHLVKTDAAARRAYVEYMHQHAALAWSIGAQGEFSLGALEEMTGNKIVDAGPALAGHGSAAGELPRPLGGEGRGEGVEQSATDTLPALSGLFPRREKVHLPPGMRVNVFSNWTGNSSWWRMAAALAAGAFLASGAFWLGHSNTPETAQSSAGPAQFATLIESKNCKWGPGKLPTENGSRLGKGWLRLAEGLVTVSFDNGTRVQLEAPAEVELISPLRCTLRQGVLVARVSPQAKGFMVETPTARLVDYGTEFGVSASSTGETQVHVLEGVVDVQQRTSHQVQRLTAGKNSHVSATQLAAIDARTFEPQRVSSAPPATEIAPGTITVTTAFGRGKDAFVQSSPTDQHRSDVLLMVKNPISQSFRRKAYMGFDLSPVQGKKISDAKLVLSMEPSGYGYASFTPDCTFTLYGLVDQSLDGWQEDGITWENAPANVTDDGASVDLTKAVKIDSFEVPGGTISGEFAVSSAALVDFLNQDTNGIATFILVRDTREQKSYSLVHGFVSKRHPTGAPPTLRLSVK